MRTSRILWTVVAAFALSLPARGDLVTGIKAIVHDSLVTYQEVEILTAQTADVIVRQYAGKPDVLEKKMNEARAENLEKQLDRQLILHDFQTAGYNLPESILDDAVQERIKTRYGDRMTLTKTLQAQGLTLEKFRQQLREQIIVEALRQKNISSEIIISPHKIEAYYLAHRDDFKLEDEVRLRMIVLNKQSEAERARARTLADEILTKVKEGASFAEMAGIYSQGSQRKEQGDWGWVEKSVLRKELADVAFSLKPGENSGVIDTPEACYLMRIEDARPAHFKSLGDVREQIEKLLLLEERNRLEQQWIDKLKKKTFVRYF